MRPAVAFLAVVCSATALAQSATPPSTPPMVGDKPLVQVKPHGAARAEASPAKSAAGKNQPMAVRLQACLEIDDGTKERLNCYDEVIKPEPKATKTAAAKRVVDCKYSKEEDERLACYNGFVESMPKLPKS
ncbi:MAG TPA: hypothetical protein VKY22_15515 [Bradyrhizobium sp.]|nr:hypothetical protein [Bradyrhizobium sp.]